MSGPYACASTGLLTAAICMKTPALVDVGRLIDTTRQRFKDGKIDDPANLQFKRVWIFHGTKDTVVGPGIQRAPNFLSLAKVPVWVISENIYFSYLASGPKIQQYYEAFGANVTTVFDMPAAHGFVSSSPKRYFEYLAILNQWAVIYH